MLLYCRCCACHLVVGDLNDAIKFFVALLFDPQAPAFLLKKRKLLAYHKISHRTFLEPKVR